MKDEHDELNTRQPVSMLYMDEPGKRIAGDWKHSVARVGWKRVSDLSIHFVPTYLSMIVD